MVNPFQLASMVVDWMDPEKAVYAPLSYVFNNPFTFSSEKCLVARKTTAFISISPRTSSKPCLMTILHVGKHIFPADCFYSIISHTKARARKFYVRS